ncbi:hypothetical protein PGAL8A_00180700 [Plasmodium gallinaceum]|uniref:Early transcribed membrane protein n=1 Tax=Plasmodium gallinaceum TaxID=5849 RepID=A0A1J1GPQ2_PLAGA|nr:hypothetical protein PGAL8A_00180700 [Plasmodium gallinaceum]CRG94418.1 hypothetical protein PGAL8A_00180700 [Plasmodium gallinaceum]
MKFSKVLFIFSVFLAVKYFNPCHCDNENAPSEQIIQVPSSALDEASLAKVDLDIEKKKRNEKLLLISSIATGLAVLIASAVGLGIYTKKRGESEEEEPAEKNSNEETKNSEQGDEN